MSCLEPGRTRVGPKPLVPRTPQRNFRPTEDSGGWEMDPISCSDLGLPLPPLLMCRVQILGEVVGSGWSVRTSRSQTEGRTRGVETHVGD